MLLHDATKQKSYLGCIRYYIYLGCILYYILLICLSLQLNLLAFSFDIKGVVQKLADTIKAHFIRSSSEVRSVYQPYHYQLKYLNHGNIMDKHMSTLNLQQGPIF